MLVQPAQGNLEHHNIATCIWTICPWFPSSCSFSTFAAVSQGDTSEFLFHACPGEVIWMRHILDKYHAAAKQQGVRIVHCCGFDSIPSDLGTCLVVDHLNRLGKYVPKVCHIDYCLNPSNTVPLASLFALNTATHHALSSAHLHPGPPH